MILQIVSLHQRSQQSNIAQKNGDNSKHFQALETH